MATITRFEDLTVWKMARDFSSNIFHETLCQKSIELSKGISAFIDYLKQSEIKGIKYKKV